MKTPAFYPKLALGNLWRNRKTYLPYLLACVVSIFTLYTLLAINTNGALDGIRQESIVKSFTAVGSIIMALFCSILIFYTNSFLIKRRKKELGLYSILGMEKKNIAVLMFFETLFVAVMALAIGLGLGLLLSKLLFWVLLRMVRFPVMMEMPVSLTAIGITTAFFGVVFLLALLSNLRQVRVADPSSLMAGAKQGEREPKASLLLTIIGLLCLGGGYFVALYFTSPLEVIMLFLLAVALVILGTYCLFTSGSVALLKLLRKNKKYYYRPDHFISVSGMIYRMKQNAAGLATICILSCMVLVTVSSTVSLNVGAEDSLKSQYPYEYSISFIENQDAGALLAKAEATAQASGVVLANLQDYHETGFMAQEQDGAFVASDINLGGGKLLDYFSLLTLEDYNRNEGKNVTLNEEEALLLVTGGRYGHDTLTLNGLTYKVQPLEELGKTTSGSRDLGRSMTLVLPNMTVVDTLVATNETPPARLRTLAFDLEGTEAAIQQFALDFDAYVNSMGADSYYRYHIREAAKEDWYASNGGFLFLGIYFGVLFMLSAALVIYYKQISEGYDDTERFEILQKVGMGEAEVKQTINRQILSVFFLPLLAAVVHIAVAFFPISRAMVVFGVMNTPLLVITCVLTVLAYTLVYLLVFRQTARTYFGIVRRQAASA